MENCFAEIIRLARSKLIVKPNWLRMLSSVVNKAKEPFLNTLVLSVCQFLQLDHKWPISRTRLLEKAVDSRLVKNVDSVFTDRLIRYLHEPVKA